MKIGILGSGDVGKELAKGFIAEGHDVIIGTREPDGEKGTDLAAAVPQASVTDFKGAASAADIVVFSINSSGVTDAINLAGSENFAGKILIDTVNVLEMNGSILVYGGGEVSVAEQIQQALPDAKVVKAFNTVGAATMYQPEFGNIIPTMFIAGDDADAKSKVGDIVRQFGWDPLDTGPIIAARSLEAAAPIWVNNSMATQSPHHAFKML